MKTDDFKVGDLVTVNNPHDGVWRVTEILQGELYGCITIKQGNVFIRVTEGHIAPLAAPMRCTSCDSTMLSWDLSMANTTRVADGRLRVSDVAPHVYLGCDECSETIMVIRDFDAVLEYLNATKFRPPASS